MAVVTKDNSKKVAKSALDVVERNMRAAVFLLERQAKLNVSRGQPPSAPGEFPHVLTGQFRSSITSQVERGPREVVGRMGSHLDRSLHLEMGTSRMSARPWLRPTYKQSQATVKKLLARPK